MKTLKAFEYAVFDRKENHAEPDFCQCGKNGGSWEVLRERTLLGAEQELLKHFDHGILETRSGEVKNYDIFKVPFPKTETSTMLWGDELVTIEDKIQERMQHVETVSVSYDEDTKGNVAIIR